MNLINKITLIIITYIIMACANANYINIDKVFIKIETNIILKSKIKDNINVIKAITLNKNEREIKKKVIHELIFLNIYRDAIKKYNIIFEKSWLLSIYEELAEKHFIVNNDIKKYIKKKYYVNDKKLTTFIIENLTYNKLQRNKILEEINISKDDITDFFLTTNYIKQNKILNEYKIIQISLNKKIKNCAAKIKEIKKTLKKTNNIKEIDKIRTNRISVRYIEINQNNKKMNFLKDFISNKNLDDIFGPIYINGQIFIFKILYKKNKAEDYKNYIKLCIKELNKIKIENKDYKTKNKKKCYWIHKDNIENNIFNKIKNLKENEKYVIIKNKIGTYKIKVKDKTFNQKSNIFNYVEEHIALEKIKLNHIDFEETTINNLNIKYYK